MSNEQQLKDEIKKIIVNITEIPDHKIQDESNFIDDLGIESIMAIDIVSAIEEKYSIEISDEKLGELDCLSAVVEAVKDELESKIS